MKTRNIVAGGAGVLATGAVVSQNPGVVPQIAGGALGIIQGVGGKVADTLNYITPNVLPAGIAGYAAPFATAAGGLYLTNKVMDKVGVDNLVARRLAQAGSVLGGFALDAQYQAALLGTVAAVGVWKGGKYLWNKAASKKVATAS